MIEKIIGTIWILLITILLIHYCNLGEQRALILHYSNRIEEAW